MNMEARIRAIEERLEQVEIAHQAEAERRRRIFELVERIDSNMASIATRVSALSGNLPPANAVLNSPIVRVDAIESTVNMLSAKLDGISAKLDEVLELLRQQPRSQLH
jgi:archaellum component FlaC